MKNGIGGFSLCLSLLTVSCGGTNPRDMGAAQTYTFALMEANSLRYSEANKYFATGVKEAMEGARGAIPGGFTGIWDKATKNGSIERIEIVKEEIHGDEAAVSSRWIKERVMRLNSVTTSASPGRT